VLGLSVSFISQGASLTKKKDCLVVKNNELRLVSELVRNSRKSDRELARIVGVSQPTVTRMRTRLEKEGIIREYTMLPEFTWLGYELLVFTFLKYEKPLNQEQYGEIREKALALQEKSASSTLIVADGIGMGSDRIIVTLHRDYSTYNSYTRDMSKLSAYKISYVGSFIVSLRDLRSTGLLTFSNLADRIPKLRKEE
jgi:DNA-binding Lrp family transcriptional regulator